VAKYLNFPQRFGLVCRLWEIEPSNKQLSDALGVDPSVLTRWANFATQTTDKGRSEPTLIADFVNYLQESKALARRGYTSSEFAECFRSYDDKQFLQFLAARSLPASVLELSQPKFNQVCRALLGQSSKARYFMYRFGTFEREDLSTFPDPIKGRALLNAKARVLRRVPASIQRLVGESFLLYREAYRKNEESIGSVFNVDTHFTIWGQDYNDTTSELFLITIKPDEIPSGALAGLFACAVLMLGDGNEITACKALMRRVPDDPVKDNTAQQNDDLAQDTEFKSFAQEAQRTIVLAAVAKDATGYQIDTSFKQEDTEPETNIPYKEYADYLSIKNETEAIVLR
jgi:hypothetical protein